MSKEKKISLSYAITYAIEKSSKIKIVSSNDEDQKKFFEYMENLNDVNNQHEVNLGVFLWNKFLKDHLNPFIDAIPEESKLKNIKTSFFNKYIEKFGIDSNFDSIEVHEDEDDNENLEYYSSILLDQFIQMIEFYKTKVLNPKELEEVQNYNPNSIYIH